MILRADDSVLSQDIPDRCLRHPGHCHGGCRKPVWSSLLSSSRAAHPARSPAPTGSPAHGSTSWWPVTAPKATQRSNRSRRPRTRPGDIGRDGRADRRAPPQSRRARPRRRPRHDRLAPRAPPPHRGCPGPPIYRICDAPGWSPPNPPRSPASYIRFAAEQPNETWQADFTHYRLADGTDAEILTWLDDHSRYALSVTAHRRHRTRSSSPPSASDAGTAPRAHPDRQRDGVHHPLRRRPWGPQRLRDDLAHLGITQKNSRPNHPTTCGKVERFQQTMKAGSAPNPPPDHRRAPDPARHLRRPYNHQRPHRSLPTRHPRRRLPRPPQSHPRPHHPNTHFRVRHDRVHAGNVTLRHHGHLHHIGLGRTPRNPRHPAHRRPRHPHHPRRHRRTPPHPHPRSRTPLLAHQQPRRLTPGDDVRPDQVDEAISQSKAPPDPDGGPDRPRSAV